MHGRQAASSAETRFMTSSPAVLCGGDDRENQRSSGNKPVKLNTGHVELLIVNIRTFQVFNRPDKNRIGNHDIPYSHHMAGLFGKSGFVR